MLVLRPCEEVSDHTNILTGAYNQLKTLDTIDVSIHRFHMLIAYIIAFQEISLNSQKVSLNPS